MKTAIVVIGCIALVIAIAVSISTAVRQYSRAVTAIDAVEVEPGVKCASMVTSDGVALSCWKVNEW